MHNGDGGGSYVLEGSYITIRGKRGIHFHSEPLTLDDATRLLRKKHEILSDETVIVLINTGQDKNGVEGHAAQTDRMNEDREMSTDEIQSFISFLDRVPKSPWG